MVEIRPGLLIRLSPSLRRSSTAAAKRAGGRWRRRSDEEPIECGA